MKWLFVLPLLLLSCGKDSPTESPHVTTYYPRAEGKEVFCGLGFADSFCQSRGWDKALSYKCYTIAKPDGAHIYLESCTCADE